MNKIITALILVAFIILSPNQPAAAQSPRPIYIVQEGDNLYTIALRFNLSVDELIQANTLLDPDSLNVGDEIEIPGLDGVSGVLTSQIVPFGENLTSISRRYGVSTEMLVKLNHITSPSELYAGANLILPQPETELPTFDRTVMAADLSLLELAAQKSSDFWTALALNGQQNSWAIPGGQSVFFQGIPDQEEGSGIDPSLESVTVKGMPLEQGRTLVLEVITKEPLKLSGDWNGTALTFFSETENQYVALQGIHAMLNPGLYPLTISGVLDDGRQFSFEQMVAVQQNYRFVGNRGDPPEKLAVDQSGLDPAINDPENRQVLEMVTAANPTRFWQGIFTVPGYNREWLTSRFGNRRLYNNDPNLYFHTGLDFAGGTGLPIKAAADGIVVYAGPLSVRGNATFIDHGWGVYTSYFHQSEIKVKVGDRVTAGQEIGLVGATGLRLTGAHLHWEVWVNGVQVDPLDWLDMQFP